MNLEKQKQENKNKDLSIINETNRHLKPLSNKKIIKLHTCKITKQDIPEVKDHLKQNVLHKAQRIYRYEKRQSFLDKTKQHHQ